MNQNNSNFNLPIVSIITVVYNAEQYLERTIKSILNQTYKNIEYIIIDGGSTDSSIEIIKKYKDNIAYWVSESDNGMYDALNKGLAVASGQLINFCNSDDLFYSNNVIEKVVTIYNIKQFDCCYGYAEFIDDKDKHLAFHYALPFKKRYIATLGSFFMQPSFFWSKKVMLESGYFNLDYKIASDRDFIGRILINSNKVERIDDYLVKFRKHGESFGDKNSEIAAMETSEIKGELSSMIHINKAIEPFYEFYDRVIQKVFRIYKSYTQN